MKGKNTSWTVYDQVMGSVEQEDGSVFMGLPFQGIMGIGKHSLTLNGHRNILENLIYNGCLKHNVISFDLNEEHNSTVELGDYNTNNLINNEVKW